MKGLPDLCLALYLIVVIGLDPGLIVTSSRRRHTVPLTTRHYCTCQTTSRTLAAGVSSSWMRMETGPWSLESVRRAGVVGIWDRCCTLKIILCAQEGGQMLSGFLCDSSSTFSPKTPSTHTAWPHREVGQL